MRLISHTVSLVRSYSLTRCCIMYFEYWKVLLIDIYNYTIMHIVQHNKAHIYSKQYCVATVDIFDL
jgi:hypothetical protein